MSQDNDNSSTTNLPEEQVSGDDSEAVVEGNVSSPEPTNDKDDGERSESDANPEEAELTEKARQVLEFHRLFQETANDVDGSNELADKLDKWKDPNDPKLLKELVNTPLEDSKTTPLHIATHKGFLEMTRQLLKAGANVNAQDDEGNQPLHMACNADNDELVTILLKDQDYTPNCDDDGRYPLHTACYRASQFEPETLRLLCNSHHLYINKPEHRIDWTPLNMAVYWGQERGVEILLEANPKFGIQDSDGWTPLIAAATEGYYGIFDKLTSHLKEKLKAHVVENIAEDVAEDVVEDVADVEDVVDKTDNRGMTALMELCVALSQGTEYSQEALQSLKNFLELKPTINIADNQGRTALHHIMRSAADLENPDDAMQEVLNKVLSSAAEEDLLLRDSQGETAFDVVFREDGPVEGLRPALEQMFDRLKKSRVEELVSWLAVRVERHSFVNDRLSALPKDADTEEPSQLHDLGEWAIRRGLPGCLLDYVMAIGQSKPENAPDNFKEAKERWKETIRGLKMKETEREQSRNPHLDGEKKKKKGHQEVQDKDKTKDGQITVLEDMEDIVDFFFVEKAPTSGETREISKPTPKMKESLDKFYAAVIQMRQDENELSRFTKFRTVNHVIYGAETLATVGEIIKRSKKLRSVSNDTAESSERDDPKPGQEFTWIHLPSTNMVWMNDIMRKILRISGCGDDEFEELASFFRASWVEIPDRTSASRFMRPRCAKRKPARAAGKGAEVENNKDTADIQEHNTSQAQTNKGRKTKLSDSSALYMPYLSFSTYHKKDPNVSETARPQTQGEGEQRSSNDDKQTPGTANYRRKWRTKLFDAYKGTTFHASSTLDEYYYHFAKDPESKKDQSLRNKDQVVTKYLYPKGVKDVATWPLLRVNQLWAWTIGEDWLITSSSCASSDEQSKFVMDILNHLRKRTKDGNHWRGPTSPVDLRKVIAEYCIGVYERKYKLHEVLCVSNEVIRTSLVKGDQGEVCSSSTQDSVNSDMEKPERSIRQIFSDSINTIGRGEADLFHMFCGGHPQDKEKEQQLADLKGATKKAAKLLFEIKDIRDELNILKTIAKSQQKVQSGMAKNEKKDTSNNLDKDTASQYVFTDIRELDTAASQTQAALHTTITLQESQIANLQAEVSVKQGRTVLVFTLFTIVFVPLSFFSSLFALDVASFLEAPAWSLIAIFTAPLPFLGAAAAYVYGSKKHDSAGENNHQSGQEQCDVQIVKSQGCPVGKTTRAGLNQKGWVYGGDPDLEAQRRAQKTGPRDPQHYH